MATTIPVHSFMFNNQSRTFEAMLDIAKYSSISFHSSWPKNSPKSKHSYIYSTVCKKYIKVPNLDIDEIVFGSDPEEINFSVLDEVPKLSPEIPKETIRTRTSQPGFSKFNNNMYASIFSLFVDRVIEWARINHSTDYPSWPPVLNFCRVIRNACIHSGKVNLSANSPISVSWRGRTLDKNNAGQEIFSDNIISSGDLVLMLFDLEFELATIRAPNPIP